MTVMTDEGEAPELRLGARPEPGAVAGCVQCGHPYAMHSNGRTACRAFACTAGHSVTCSACGGTTRSVASGKACTACDGTGSVAVPCQGFVRADQAA